MNDVEECLQQHKLTTNKEDDVTHLLSSVCVSSSSLRSPNLYDDLDLADSEEKALLDLLDLNNIANVPSVTAMLKGPSEGSTDLLSLEEFVDTSSAIIDSDFTRIIRSLKASRENLPDCKPCTDVVAIPTSGKKAKSESPSVYMNVYSLKCKVV